jgi:hypothetical protein
MPTNIFSNNDVISVKKVLGYVYIGLVGILRFTKGCLSHFVLNSDSWKLTSITFTKRIHGSAQDGEGGLNWLCCMVT